MAESYTTLQTDTRNLGMLVARLLDDLNRPDLSAQALEYVQDAIRLYQRRPWLFNETDNSATSFYANSTNYPQGSVIQATIGGTAYAICALTAGQSAASSTPAFPSTVFTTPSSGPPPPAVGTPGTVIDGAIVWANVGLWSSSLFTQLCTVYNVNQVVPPLDYISPERIEVTAANLRFQLAKIPYGTLRDYDVIRPAPITVYPTFWAWFQQQIYLWPYPNGQYPLTISYRTAPPMISAPNQSNFWTQIGERMIRKQAQYMMELEIIHDPDAAATSLRSAKDEESSLRSMQIMQNNPTDSGIPASDW